MKNLRNTIATATLAAAMLFGTTFANAGILLSDLKSDETPQNCTETKGKMDWGILLSDFTGILLSDFTGTIITGAKQEPTVNCGILLAD